MNICFKESNVYYRLFIFKILFYVLCAANRCRDERTTFRSSFSLFALLREVGSLVSATVLCTPGWLVHKLSLSPISWEYRDCTRLFTWVLEI